MSNRLAHETSPYLLQHKDNPVDWYPWGDAALAAAKASGKPIFLSIGYSACHWCHVMERESFENPEIAEIMNRLFVNIKVDREERPDLDSIYMTAVQAMTGHGGWPMSVFLTPDGEPFYGGTYFPNDERGGMPSFPRVLQSVHDAYQNRRGDIVGNGARLVEAIRSRTQAHRSIEPMTSALFSNAYRLLSADFDDMRGGTGIQPKFPQPTLYEFLLAHAMTAGDADALTFTNLTLEKMANGGIHDQVGGGFHRYSVDSVWLVPHFEKMLYDNAQLASLYCHAWLASTHQPFKDVTTTTLEYLGREMWHAPSGAFLSATDADSEGEEGLFFVWSHAEFMEVLGAELGEIVGSYWGVERDGNFEGRNILNVATSKAAVARRFGIGVPELEAKVADARAKLYEHRSQRVPPMTDDKAVTSWNALALRAFAEAGASFGRPDWIEIAKANAKFLTGNMTRSDGRLMRTFKPSDDSSSGTLSPILGFLEDYGCLADALLTLYQADFDAKWLREAHRLCQEAIRLFWDEAESAFYDTGIDQEQLVVRPRDIFDNAQPSGCAAMTFALLRCAEFTGDQDMARYAAQSLRSAVRLMQHAPAAVTWWLRAAQFYVNPVQQVVIVGEMNDPRTNELLAVVRSEFRPHCILALLDPNDPARGTTDLPLFEGRTMIGGVPTAYVCRDYVCELPVSTPAALRQQLQSG